MKRLIAAAITLLCVACGDSSDAPPAGASPASRSAQGTGAGNEPPEISSAAIEPSEAGASDALSVEVVARDPERRAVRLTVEWYRNGELVGDLDETTVPAGSFARGDRIYAIAYASDGEHEVSHQTRTVTLGNSAPTVRRITITPPAATGLDLLQAEAQVEDADGDAVELRHRWLRNGQPIPNAEGPRIPPGIGHRGEQIVAQVQATDGSNDSPWVSSTPIVLANAAPAVTTQPNYTLSGSGQYSYEVAAADPDGDRPLKYELVEGPQGMSVDVVTGRVTWRVPVDAKGVYPIELAVSDPYGGKTTQKYSLAVDWTEAPASASDTQAGARGKSGAVPAVVDSKARRPSGEAAAKRDEDYTEEDQAEEPADDEF